MPLIDLIAYTVSMRAPDIYRRNDMRKATILCMGIVMILASYAVFAQPAGAPAGGMGGGAMKDTDTSAVKNKYLDIAYATVSKTQTLDVYLPNTGTGPFPTIISIHGGGFAFGNNRGTELATALKALERGYAVVSVNYRLSGEAVYPAAINDVKAAIRFARANASKYKLDPSRFASFGSSAGGHLAALVGTSGDSPVFKDATLGNASVSDAVQAVVDWYGPINFLVMDEQFKASGVQGQTHNIADSFESKYMGALITGIPAKIKETNPETYIDSRDPPFFIQHGTADANIPTQQSIDFAARLTTALGKDRVVYSSIQGAGHGGAQFETEANIKLMLDFLDKHLK